ncbi:pirin family protein [Microbacterium sp. ASV49]|uniref:Pirin family protein n=1 Tax=Microbacterium candidum TaxID=3041922 RepID=A0ABT7MUP1_9MICO|nr:pirin family protein [Microbacterium sp. ASV49]MDL9978175.1 pirin family protein [Microbacterium sp. ASV49]
MTRLDAGPLEAEAAAECDGPRTLLLEAREVPLGGVRAMEVRRSLPQRDLPMIGAWCFLDRFGPQPTRMRVEPHPHIGLQTVTWPLIGEVRHRDTVGSDVVVRRGQLNLMTSGAGIAHSEYSVGEDPIPLDALQLWVALPESRRHEGPAFEQHTELPAVDLGGGARATVVMGEFAGAASPASAYTPIAGVEISLPAGSTVTLPLTWDWEYGIVGVTGTATVEGTDVGRDHLLYLGIHRDAVEVAAEEDATIFLLGGMPFEDEIVMWWNFVARTHDEIVEAREAWEADSPRFGHVVGHGDERIPAPPMPAVRLTRRHRRI